MTATEVIYKVVREEDGKLFSFMKNKGWEIEYIPQIAIFPLGNSYLYGFVNFRSAFRFLDRYSKHYRNYEIWKARASIVPDSKPRIAGANFSPGTKDYYTIGEFWNWKGTDEQFQNFIFAPEGTIWCKWIELIEKADTEKIYQLRRAL